MLISNTLKKEKPPQSSGSSSTAIYNRADTLDYKLQYMENIKVTVSYN